MADALIGTAVPILLLMVIGFVSRKFGVLKQGDERVLRAYVCARAYALLVNRYSIFLKVFSGKRFSFFYFFYGYS